MPLPVHSTKSKDLMEPAFPRSLALDAAKTKLPVIDQMLTHPGTSTTSRLRSYVQTTWPIPSSVRSTMQPTPGCVVMAVYSLAPLREIIVFKTSPLNFRPYASGKFLNAMVPKKRKKKRPEKSKIGHISAKEEKKQRKSLALALLILLCLLVAFTVFVTMKTPQSQGHFRIPLNLLLMDVILAPCAVFALYDWFKH